MGLKYVLVFSLLHLLAADETEKLKVSIYYETFCPCSIDFITKQFFPVYLKLKNYLEIDFVPSGNTTHEFVDGSWVFWCKHGKQECHANKIHACTLMQNINEFQKVEFINCITTGNYAKYEVETCAAFAGISWKKIKECVDDLATDHVLAEFGNRTKMANLAHIPAVSFNDQYSKSLDQSARKNFLSTVCNLFHKAPEVCTNVKINAL